MIVDTWEGLVEVHADVISALSTDSSTNDITVILRSSKYFSNSKYGQKNIAVVKTVFKEKCCRTHAETVDR